jgi:hypothetical protein
MIKTCKTQKFPWRVATEDAETAAVALEDGVQVEAGRANRRRRWSAEIRGSLEDGHLGLSVGLEDRTVDKVEPRLLSQVARALCLAKAQKFLVDESGDPPVLVLASLLLFQTSQLESESVGILASLFLETDALGVEHVTHRVGDLRKRQIGHGRAQ